MSKFMTQNLVSNNVNKTEFIEGKLVHVNSISLTQNVGMHKTQFFWSQKW